MDWIPLQEKSRIQKEERERKEYKLENGLNAKVHSMQSTPDCLLWGLTLKGQQWKLKKKKKEKEIKT